MRVDSAWEDAWSAWWCRARPRSRSRRSDATPARFVGEVTGEEFALESASLESFPISFPKPKPTPTTDDGATATRLSSCARSQSCGCTGVGGPTRGNVYIGDVDAPDPMNPPPVRRPYTASTRSPPGVTSSTLTPPGFLSAPLMTRPSDPEWNSGL